MFVAAGSLLLRLSTGPLAGKVFEVTATFRIGRHPFNELSLGDPRSLRLPLLDHRPEGRRSCSRIWPAPTGPSSTAERVRARLDPEGRRRDPRGLDRDHRRSGVAERSRRSTFTARSRARLSQDSADGQADAVDAGRFVDVSVKRQRRPVPLDEGADRAAAHGSAVIQASQGRSPGRGVGHIHRLRRVRERRQALQIRWSRQRRSG